jgi:hypothetical protein
MKMILVHIISILFYFYQKQKRMNLTKPGFFSTCLAILIFLLFTSACERPASPGRPAQDSQSQAKLPAVSSPEWDRMFYRKSGWFGGDGIFAIPLDGKESLPAGENTKTLFVFSDSVIGEIDGEEIGGDDYKMIHNLVAYLEGGEPDPDKFEFYWAKDENGKPVSLFEPQTPDSQPGEYYWLGDGFVNVEADSTLYIFAYRIRDAKTDSFFEFEQLGVSIIAIPHGSSAPFEDQRQLETPFFYPYKDGSGNATFGSGIFVNTASAGAPDPDGYIYVYGVAGIYVQLLAARVKPEDFEKFDAWEFWNGSAWVADMNQAASITNGVSHELSLSPLPDGRYILAHQRFGLTPEVAVQVGKSPVGPFFPAKTVWHCPEVNEDLDFFVYNAKAYPHLSKPGELLISYNVNSYDFFVDILTQPHFCRPRFVRVRL